jgi:hypothetical protein
MKMPADSLGLALFVGLGGYVALSSTLFLAQGFLQHRREEKEREALAKQWAQQALQADTVDENDDATDPLPTGTKKKRKNKRNPHQATDGAPTTTVKQSAVHVLKRLVKVCRALFFPLSTIGVIACTAAKSDQVLSVVPPLFRSYGKSLQQYLPLYAHTKTQAFEFGQAYHTLTTLIANTPGGLANVAGAAVDAVLKTVSAIAGRNVTLTEVLQLPADLAAQDADKGAASRVLGLFSFVNIIWFGAIVGITMLSVPFMHVFAKPAARVFWYAWEKVVLPTLIALKPVYEPILYCLTCFVFVESLRFPRTEVDTTGTMIALTSLSFYVGSWVYTTYLISEGGGNKDLWVGLTALMVSAAVAPMAVAHRSTLLGYAAVTALISSLGFTAIGTPLYLVIGFDERLAAYRVALVCLLMTLTNAAVRIAEVDVTLLKPFESAINCFGTAVYFLALSIISVTGDRAKGALVYVANVIAYVAVGSIFNMPGLRNAALAWAVVEAFVWSSFMVIFYRFNRHDAYLVIYGFLASCALYGISLYLSSHPQMLTALFTTVTA